jgi:hypothetical protein
MSTNGFVAQSSTWRKFENSRKLMNFNNPNVIRDKDYSKDLGYKLLNCTNLDLINRF